MRIKSLLLSAIVIFSLAFTPDDDKKLSKIAEDQSKYTNVGNIGMTVTNFGLLGNGFSYYPNYYPSCEYPLGSGIEHFFDACLWVGGFKKNDSLSTSLDGPYVTTAGIDIASLSVRGGGFEFTNRAGSKLIERSSLLDSKNYSPDAISHQDFVADYSDTSLTFLNGEPIIEHTPLGIAVHQETYTWNFPFADFFVICNYTIKNVGNKYLDSMYVGIWADAVVRNTKVTAPRGSSFYQHGGNGYDDSLRVAYEWDYDGDKGFTDSYVGFLYLGSTPEIPSKFVNGLDTLPSTNFSVWSYNSSGNEYFTPRTEFDRYRRMQGYFNGTNRFGKGINPQDIKVPNGRQFAPIITHGHYKNLAPGDSLNIVYAVVCAKKFGNDPASLDTREQRNTFYSNCDWALRAYFGNDRNRNGIVEPDEDIFSDGKVHRYILPAPPVVPNVKVVPEKNKATIYWDKRAELSIDPISGKKDFAGYKIYRTQAGFDLNTIQDIRGSLVLLAQYDTAGDGGAGYNVGFHQVELSTAKTFEGDTTKYWYKLEVPNLLDGWQYLFSVTAFDKGDPENKLGSLESSFLTNLKRILPGTPASEDANVQIGVYPNPYYGNALWDGSSERLRKIYFYNLPTECEITIYTLAGDVIKKMNHSALDNGSNIRWFEQYATDKKQQFAGGEHAWDLITDNDQAIATGMYLFTVKNNNNGQIKTGKFLIIK